ncbi:hypothetical protein [Rhizobium laguerreae]|uniref:hypothetical protein n=1 Tax=Rhizobium laguerreae TaxID=1076926 RepID=UPI001C8FF275|nr:hypothetical protein [Rhizobium laguerreae]MBY3383203.1 hypothetical protein [Rhizobium laguerreae]
MASRGGASAYQLFNNAPCLGVWSTLAPLAENYGEANAEIYRHLSDALGLDLHDPANRPLFKFNYKKAAARIGVALSGNDPTSLFFAPLGVADAQIPPLADAMVAAMARLGPPATEDTSMAVAWQRRLLGWCPEALTRLRAAVLFDKVGHYAARANLWRIGENPEPGRDEILFAALDRAARAQGVRREVIVAPPEIAWLNEGLALLPETAHVAQSIMLGAFPTRLIGGVPLILPQPWQDHLTWKASRTESISCAPLAGEVLLFDADTGMLATRASVTCGSVELAGRRIIALAAGDFDAESFGPAEIAKDPGFRVAWLELDRSLELTFANGERMVLSRSIEPALRIDARPIGRSPTRPLYGGDGALEVQLNPALPGDRILRLSTGASVRHLAVTPAADGRARIDFQMLGLDHPGDPVRAMFDILALGARKDSDARSELRTAAFIWPGVQRGSSGDIDDAALPSTFNASRSAGFETARGRLWMTPEAAVNAAILAVEIDGELVEFACSFRGTRLWWHRIATGTRERVARGTRLVFGHANRNDTLTIQACDCRADVRVLGRLKSAPLVARSEFAIGAELLEPSGDDRVLLEYPDGTTELLARVTRTNDPIDLVVGAASDALTVTFRPQNQIDAVGVRIETTDGAVSTGQVSLGARSVDSRLPQATTIRQLSDGSVELTVTWPKEAPPARLEVLTRSARAEHFEILRGADGYPAAIGLPGRDPAPTAQNLTALARLLAEPTTMALGGQLAAVLGPCHQRIISELGGDRAASRILPALTVECPSGGLPRADILTGAPWLFEAPLTAFMRLATHPELSALGRMAGLDAPKDLPNPRGEDPLRQWLERVAVGDGLPRELGAGGLDAAFVALRTRLARRDLAELTGNGLVGNTVRLLVSVDVPELDRLRAFDRMMGHDVFAARLVSLIERFARASRLKLAEPAMKEMVGRTGLAPPEVGAALTLVCRTGVEALAYFLMVWDLATREHEQKT